MVFFKNYMEDIVEDTMKVIKKNLPVCDCPQCTSDIMALALNSLPPKYVVTRKGELYSKLATIRQQCEVDVLTAVTKAITTVRDSPRH